MSVRNYAILYGGKSKSSVSTIGGGNAILDTGTHAFVGPEHTGEEITSIPTTETDTTLVLRPDGTGGVAFGADTGVNAELNIEGGQSVIKAHGSMGATETFDPTDGNVHTGTLDANCTFTLGSPSGSGACLLEIRALQNGTGGWSITWPGSVAWKGGGSPSPTTTAATTWVYTVETTDGGANWIGDWGQSVGIPSSSFATPAIVLGTAAAAGAATTAIRSDSTIVAFDATSPTTQALGDAAATGSAAVAARRDHKHAMPTLSSATPLAASGSGAVGTALPSSREDHVHPTEGATGGHVHVAGEVHLSDGSTTSYTLDAAFEPGSVEAWNTTTLAYLTVTETLPDQAAVSAAGSSGDKITFNYAATAV